MRVQGLNAHADFDGATLTISRGGGGSKLRTFIGQLGGPVSTTYLVSQISGVNFRQGTRLAIGYIQFNVAGVQSITPRTVTDERSLPLLPNVVTFRRNANEVFARLRDQVEHARRDSEVRTPEQTGTSVVEEVTRLKTLLDTGALTQAEFADLKRRILG